MSINPSLFFIQAVTSVLYGNLQTLDIENSSFSLFSDANNSLTSAWTTYTPPPEPAGGYQRDSYDNIQYKLWFDFTQNPSSTQVQSDITKYLSGSTGTTYVDQLSTGLLTLMMGGLGQLSNQTANITLLNSLSSVVSNTATAEEQPTKQTAESISSAAENFSGYQTNINTLGDAMTGVGNNTVSILQQAYA